MKKKAKIAIIVSSAFVGALALGVAIPFTVLGIRTASLQGDYSYLKEDSKYASKVEINGLELVTQHISCGYASIEMISSYYGIAVTEDDLDTKNNGSVSTSSSSGFLQEINASIPSHHFAMSNYLRNDELLKGIHEALSKNHPVAVEWAALYQNEWTLHFSVVTGLDLSSDNVTIYNPYGYIESITVDAFLHRTSFAAYENMPLFLNFGFAFGAFDKNTIFYAA